MRLLAALLGVLYLASPAQAAAPINKAFSCGKQGTVGGLGAGTDLQRITIDTKRYPEAVCNDGTPGIFYAGRYTREEDRNKWVIFLQGGGGCSSAEACAQRWCSVETNYGLDKMSTSLSKPSIQGNGVLDPRPENHFGTWNRVLIYYCSSDHWTGTKSSTQRVTVNGTNIDYDIHFKGSRIIDAVLDMLRGELTPVRARAFRPGRGAPGLPDLDDATEVLFGGASAGGEGIIDNADRVGAKLRSTNPALLYRVSIDAAFSPMQEDLDFAHSVPCATNPSVCSYTSTAHASWTNTDQALWGKRGDESCLTWHAVHEPGTEWRCGDGTHVIHNHVTTPFFIHQDEQDESIGGQYVELGFGTPTDFGTTVERQLRDLPLLNTTAEEGSVRNGGPALATPGAFGPQCTDHESLANDEAFFDVRMNGLTYADTLWNWWSGAQPQVLIHAFSGPGPAPGCPKQ